jgi:glycosyltransferase involved in cell wall biosynthesis
MVVQNPAPTARPQILFLAELVNCNDGIATYCQTLAAGLKARGCDVHMISGPVRSDAKSQGKREALEAVFSEWLVEPDMRKFPPPALIRRLAAFVRRRKIQAINAHGMGMLFVAKAVGMLTGVRVVGTYHQSVLGSLDTVKRSANRRFGPVQVAFLNLFMPYRLIVLSDLSVAFIRQHPMLQKQRVVKVMAGTDLTHFRPPTPAEKAATRRQYGLADDDLVCVLPARLAWVKGHDLLIEAVRRLRRTRPDLSVKCLFAGSGGTDREAEIKAVAAGDADDAEAFRFLGFMDDVRPALWASDAVVLPSRFEGFAIGIVEAMATGLVPIRTPTGGATDQIIDGETGYLVPFEDAEALADAIGKLADPAARDRLGALNVERAKALFGVEPMIDRMLSIYGIAAPAG